MTLEGEGYSSYLLLTPPKVGKTRGIGSKQTMEEISSNSQTSPRLKHNGEILTSSSSTNP